MMLNVCLLVVDLCRVRAVVFHFQLLGYFRVAFISAKMVTAQSPVFYDFMHSSNTA